VQVSEAVHGPIYAALAPQDEEQQGLGRGRGDENDEGARGGATPVVPLSGSSGNGGVGESAAPQPTTQGPAAAEL